MALKLAVQFQNAMAQPERTEFVTIRSGYHGGTWKAMIVCDADTGMHHLFRGAVSVQCFTDRPLVQFGAAWNPDSVANELGSLRRVFEQHHRTIAALILEPVVQGAGGCISITTTI